MPRNQELKVVISTADNAGKAMAAHAAGAEVTLVDGIISDGVSIAGITAREKAGSIPPPKRIF